MDNNENNEINLVVKKKLGQTQINNSISLENVNESKITKVLTISAKPIVEKTDVLNAEVKVNGLVEYNMLVVLDNNEINSITEKSPFSLSFESKEITENSSVDVLANVVEVNNVSGESLNFNCVINFKFYILNSMPPIKCPQEKDGVLVKTKEILYSTYVCNINYNFQLGFEEVKDSRFNKVLFISSNASIKNVLPNNEYFTVNGEVYTTIVFQNEDGLIKSVLKENEFSEEVEAKGVNKDSTICLDITTQEIEIVENLENKTYNFIIPIKLTGQIFNRNTCKTILDAYSINNEVNLTTSSYEDQSFSSTKQVSGSISTTASIDENLDPIDKILAVIPNNIYVINQVVKDGNLLLEGIVNLNIIYYSLDEEGSEILNSFDIDVPFSLNFTIEELKETDNVINNLVIRDVNIKNKLGKELEIVIDFKNNYSIITNNTNAVVSEINLGEEKQQDNFALQVYLTRNEESLWDIAKKLNITVEDLVSQNGELTMPIQDGEKIVAYKQNNVDFE